MRNLARALHRAVDQGCHVVSISMGGVPSETLAEAIRAAQDQGLIVVAAAGNEVPFVVWPARYPEVVAVAASNVRRQPWAHSSSGAAVDITAPGESVWRAETVRGATPFRVDMGSGTSFATAGVAGVAALWLSYHGRDALLARLATPGDLPRLFQAILRRAAVAPPGWDRGRYGPGIVDARRALEVSLDEAMGDLAGPIAPASAHAGLEGLLGAGARPRLARLLGVGARQLDDALAEVGDELLFRILTSPRVRESILAVAPATARARVVRGGGGEVARALLARGASTALGRYLRPGSPTAAG
jgi:subtilisin family serine protease